MLVHVPGRVVNDGVVIGDGPGRTPTPAPGAVAGLAPDLVRLALVLLVDVLFLAGVLLPYLTSDGDLGDPAVPDVLLVPLVLTLFLLPWVTFGSAAVSGYRLWRARPGAGSRGGTSSPAARGVCLCVVVLGALGLVAYFSPWGVDAIRWLVD